METSKHSVSYQASEGDVEKQGGLQSIEVNVTKDEDKQDRDAAELSLSSSDQYDAPQTPVLLKGKLARWNAKVEGLAGLEARGIARVLPEEKHDGGRLSFLKILALWVGINTVALNIITGFLGPLVFQLGWVDCVCIVIFANALSAGCGAYISTFGPESGNRTMVRERAKSSLTVKRSMHCGFHSTPPSCLADFATLRGLHNRSLADFSWATGLQNLQLFST